MLIYFSRKDFRGARHFGLIFPWNFHIQSCWRYSVPKIIDNIHSESSPPLPEVEKPVVEEEHEPPPASIDVLNEECLYEVFKHILGGRDRCACACVSKQWLMLLSSIPINRIYACPNPYEYNPDEMRKEKRTDKYGLIYRCLEGREANDTRLAAIAVGTGPRGGLGTLIIVGYDTSLVTDIGLKAIARCCPTIMVLSLWNLATIGSEAVTEFGKNHPQLRVVDINHCPEVCYSAAVDFLMNCPRFESISFSG